MHYDDQEYHSVMSRMMIVSSTEWEWLLAFITIVWIHNHVRVCFYNFFHTNAMLL